jgi:hypothetical protein
MEFPTCLSPLPLDFWQTHSQSASCFIVSYHFSLTKTIPICILFHCILLFLGILNDCLLCGDGVLLCWYLKQPWIRFFIDLITH